MLLEFVDSVACHCVRPARQENTLLMTTNVQNQIFFSVALISFLIQTLFGALKNIYVRMTYPLNEPTVPLRDVILKNACSPLYSFIITSSQQTTKFQCARILREKSKRIFASITLNMMASLIIRSRN